MPGAGAGCAAAAAAAVAPVLPCRPRVGEDAAGEPGCAGRPCGRYVSMLLSCASCCCRILSCPSLSTKKRPLMSREKSEERPAWRCMASRIMARTSPTA